MNMKHIIASFLTALVLLFAGCPSVSQASEGAAMREMANGVIEHSASGMQFPLACGDFTRAGVRQYDKNGRDVSVAYNLLSSVTPIVVTAYVYPSPAVHSFGSPASVIEDAKRTLSRGEYERCKNEVLHVHAGAQLTSETDIAAPDVTFPARGRLTHFKFVDRFAERVQPLDSLLYVYCYIGGVWTIKFRITYPADVQAEPLVQRFLQELKWTVREQN
jgi:hypothetical protein